jgi:hypothetical protein
MDLADVYRIFHPTSAQYTSKSQNKQRREILKIRAKINEIETIKKKEKEKESLKQKAASFKK